MKMKKHKAEDYLYKIKTKKDNLKIIPFSDVHFDSKKCDRVLLKKHLDLMVEQDAYCWFNGDFLDVMGCNRDPRSGKGDIRPEYDVKNYLDAVCEDAVKFLEPYKDRILFMSDGNHETNILMRQETNVLDRIARPLGVDRMGYGGFIKLSFVCGKDEDKNVFSQLIHFHHGFGGNAPRSKGVMRVDIDSANYPDADLIVRGHTHQKWAVQRQQRRLSQGGKYYKKKTLHVQLGSYKDGYGLGLKGWEVEKEFSETVLGSYLFEITKSNIKYTELD